jgi:hypothetical protein
MAHSSSVPPRRIPLLAGETPDRIQHVLPAGTGLLTADSDEHTRVWLRGQTVELLRLGALTPGEELVAITPDYTYGKTNTGRVILL